MIELIDKGEWKNRILQETFSEDIVEHIRTEKSLKGY